MFIFLSLLLCVHFVSCTFCGNQFNNSRDLCNLVSCLIFVCHFVSLISILPNGCLSLISNFILLHSILLLFCTDLRLTEMFLVYQNADIVACVITKELLRDILSKMGWTDILSWGPERQCSYVNQTS